MHENGEVAVDKSWQCVPRFLLQEVAMGIVCAEQQFFPFRNPEQCLHSRAESIMMLFWPPQQLADWLVHMDLSHFPVFGLWLQLRRIAMHRAELPFHSRSQLATSLGLRVQTSNDAIGGSGGCPVQAAFEGLLHDGQERFAILSACWGEAHAARLGFWLHAVQRADLLDRATIMCHDMAALTACRSAHTRPQHCADARQWPATLLSKLAGVALGIRLGLDILWLDSDAVLLRDPRPLITPIQAPQGDAPSDPDMLFSIEADSWNCVNAGVFFMRATERVLRYITWWLVLFLLRPFSIDQAVLLFLLGLIQNMGFADFAGRERLLDAHGPRARLLGTLSTPRWGALDSRSAFGMSAHTTTGGIDLGSTDGLAVMHLLASWPNHSIASPIYQDVPDLVGHILASLSGAGRGVPWAMELIRRSEQSSPINRRDCSRSYIAGR